MTARQEPSKAGDSTPPAFSLESVKPQLADKLESLPTLPGCYLFKDSKQRVIYVGKAKSLRQRVKSYFTGRHDGRALYTRLTNAIRDVEYIIVDSEMEALILENNLIKHHKPKYNIDLKDDRAYPFIKITSELYPQIFLIRHPRDDDARYLGPFMEVTRLRGVLRELKKIFQIRTCDLRLTQSAIDAGKFKLCLQYHLKQCEAPCVGYVNPEQYREGVQALIDLLNGRIAPIERRWQERMHELAVQKRFEEAAVVRDQLQAIQHVAGRQRVLSVEPYDRDAVGIFREDTDACVAVLRIRNGRMVGRLHYFLGQIDPQSDDGEVISDFLIRLYSTAEPPAEIIVPAENDWKLIAGTVGSLHHTKVKIECPKIGDRAGQVRMATANAELLFKQQRLAQLKRDFVPRSLTGLGELLGLQTPPRRIECFDISHLAGTGTVASMVTFVDAKPVRSEHRKFIVKTVTGIDDFASMREVVTRRYQRLLNEKKPLPDVIIVDGGKGQLNSALTALESLGINGQPILGLAKRLEEIFLPGESDSRILPRTSSVLRVLQQIRDEAHNYAVTFQQARRSGSLTSRLDSIAGIGEHRRNALLKRFKTLAGIRTAKLEEIAETANIGMKLATVIQQELTKMNHTESMKPEPHDEDSTLEPTEE